MGQAFFTLSLGIGAMAIFGSYIAKEHTLTGESIRICTLDTIVALLAGLIPEYAPISPGELIPLFSWEKLPQADCTAPLL